MGDEESGYLTASDNEWSRTVAEQDFTVSTVYSVCFGESPYGQEAFCVDAEADWEWQETCRPAITEATMYPVQLLDDEDYKLSLSYSWTLGGTGL